MEFVFCGLLALVMGAGAVSVVFDWGEAEGICKYNYTEEENEK